VKVRAVLGFIRATFILGILAGALMINLAIAPAQAATRQLEEATGETIYQSEVYQSRQTLKDEQGNSWQAIAFKRTLPDSADSIYLRLIGFPGTTNLDHSQPLTLIDSMGKTFTAADVSQDMFMDQAPLGADAGEYNLQPILMQLEAAIPLRLILPTLDQSEINLNVSPGVVEEWRSLTAPQSSLPSQ
jgi:type II secretory pathway pseudopilin PulG